jgi:predicted porin
MKKSKLASMLFGAAVMLGTVTAFAQVDPPFRGVGEAKNSTINVYGQVHTGITNQSVGTSGTLTTMSNIGSRIGFSGSENLGGDLSAFYTIETGFAADAPRGSVAATSLGDRISVVGLRKGMFELKAGRDKHVLVNLQDKYYSTFLFPDYHLGMNIHDTQGIRANNTVFLAARPVNGLLVAYQHTLSEVAGKPNTTGTRVEYDTNRVSVGVATFDDGATNKSTAYGATFRANKQLQLNAVYSEDKNLGLDTTGSSVAVSYWIQPQLLLLASVGKKTGAVELDSQNLGASYALSKRTWLHARWLKEDYKTLNTRDTTATVVSVQHMF